MTIDEFNQIKTITNSNNNWWHHSFGIIKHYYKSVTLITKDNNLIIKQTNEIMNKLSINDATILKSYGWNIINNKLQKQLTDNIEINNLQ